MATSSVSQLPVWSETAIESCLHGQQVVCVVGKPSAMASHRQQQVIGNIGNSKSSAMASDWQHRQRQLVVSASCLCGPKLQLRASHQQHQQHWQHWQQQVIGNSN